MDAQGNLYGTTVNGGNLDKLCPMGCGVVFKLSKTGKETVLHRFNGANGGFPSAGVIQDAKGRLYGTTEYGGAYGSGTVFMVSKTGRESVLYSFCPQSVCTDGANPYAGLIRDAKGNLFGTTFYGGSYNEGTVFKLSKVGKETVLYSFCRTDLCADGRNPYSGVIQDAEGNFYGTTSQGGTTDSGTVFKLSKTGKETVLHSFIYGAEGAFPFAGVIQDTKGNLYGTTEGGGGSNGEVFRVSKTGEKSALYSFTGGSDGEMPVGGVIRDAKGNIYGTTVLGGDMRCGSGCGVVFKLDKTGKETVLRSFTGGADGSYSEAGVIRDAKGNLYGTTTEGGDLSCDPRSGCGVAFKLTP
jgi:uncharacterized repeat protein (TIGR03803 family)